MISLGIHDGIQRTFLASYTRKRDKGDLRKLYQTNRKREIEKFKL